jgi:transposase
MARKTYTREFKPQALRMLTDQGLSVAEVARRLGVGANCLRNWRQAHQEQGEAAFPGQGSPSPADEGFAASAPRSSACAPRGAC